MKCKRTIRLLLSVLMVLGTLSGCSGVPDISSNDDEPTQPAGIVSIDDPIVLQPNSSILTPTLLEKAAENPVVTSEDHPRWTGFTLGYFDDLGDPGTTPRTVELCGEWGFNSARVALRYDELFSHDMAQADMEAFYILDSMVAAAIEHNIHLH